jgi:glycerol-3-phosphate acyltransferase PlsX
MGGDNAPSIVIDGAAMALDKRRDLSFLIFGDRSLVEPLLKQHPALSAVTELRDTPDRIENETKPSTALRHGRQSSMRLAINAVKEKEAAAVVSAGNTGALMAMSKYVLKTLPGVTRPAICSLLPTKKKPVVMLDLGANVECTANELFQFAVMGEVYSRVMLNNPKPSVALLNVGTEEVKGDDVVRAAAALLRDSTLPIDFCGFVEGTDVSDGVVDVVVTDGFTGNVALKTAEGTASLFTSTLRQLFGSSWRGKIAYLIARPLLHKLRDRFDPRLYNGAMFMGLNGVVVKSHGGTDALGFANAVTVAADLASSHAPEKILDELHTIDAVEVAVGQVG